ncbi:MAG: hypothetical protein R2939_03190 [Kofleriaceae bacterium]
MASADCSAARLDELARRYAHATHPTRLLLTKLDEVHEAPELLATRRIASTHR